MIAAVATVKDEADIIDATVHHLFEQGIDVVFVADGMSTDGTRDILADLGQRVTVVDDREPFHRQPQWINRLASMAYDLGARWVVPFDADEFWCADDRRKTIADVLHSVEPGVTRVYAPVHHYVDFEWRWPESKMPKVAYRAFSWACVARGNHDVNVPGGRADGLVVRELQYRSFEHFCRKIRDRNATRPPEDPRSEGAHHWRYDGMTAEELRPVWDAMVARATVHDPILASVRG